MKTISQKVVAGIWVLTAAGTALAQSADQSNAAAAVQAPPADETPVTPVPTDVISASASPEAADAVVPVAKTATANPSGNRLIEEIIVNAQKRDEDIKDVPISIASFNADYLGAKGVIAQQDLPKITPGLTFSAPVGFATAYLRGIGSDAFILADPLVVTYIDGVYFPASTTQFQDFGSVQKVEIDKGPQGTLFGRNALGGVIAITTTDPSLTDVKAAVNSTYSSYTGTDPGRYSLNTSGFVSVPLTDNLGILVSGLLDQDKPYYNQQVGPANDRNLIEPGHAWAFRAKLLWKPTDNSNIKLNVYRFTDNDPQRNFAVNTAPSALAGSLGTQLHALVQPQDPFKGGSIDSIPQSSDQGLTYFGSGDLNTHWVDIQALGSHQKISAVRNFDFDASPVPIAYFEALNAGPNKKPFFANNQSIELRLLSNDNAPDWLKLVGGVYYFNQDSGIGAADFQAAGTNLQQGMIGGVSVPGLQNLITPLTNLVPILPQGVQLLLGGGLNDKSIAGYGQGTVNFTDWVSLTLGARYQIDKRFILFADQGVNLNDGTQVVLFHYSGKNDDRKKTPVIGQSLNSFNHEDFRTSTYSFDPKVSLNFRPGDGWLGTEPLLYVNYQTASTGNIFNTISLIARPNLAKGSKLTAYETGLKTFLFDHLVSLDAAGFYYKEKDAQSQVVSLQSGGAVHFENVPGLRTIGGDVTVLAQILPSLTADGLVLTASAAYLDSTYTSYRNASGFNQTTGLYSNNHDFTGNQAVQTPKFTTNVGLNQTFQVPGGPLEGGVDFYYNSGYYYLAQNTPNTKEQAYKTVGFTLSYLYQDWNLRVTGFGRNVLDEKYFAARFINDFGTDDFAAPLSTYGVTLRWDY